MSPEDWQVYKFHNIILISNLRAGAMEKGRVLETVGFSCSLEKSFSTSAIGWGRPKIMTLFGPLRFWA